MKSKLLRQTLSLILCISMLLSLGAVPMASALESAFDLSKIIKTCADGATITVAENGPEDYKWLSYSKSGWTADGGCTDLAHSSYSLDEVGLQSTLKLNITTTFAAKFSFDICISNYNQSSTTSKLTVKINDTPYNFNGQSTDVFTSNTSTTTAYKVYEGTDNPSKGHKVYTVDLNKGSNTVEFTYTKGNGGTGKQCVYLTNLVVEKDNSGGTEVNTNFVLPNNLTATYKIGDGDEQSLNGSIAAPKDSSVTVTASFTDTNYIEYDGFYDKDSGEKLTSEKSFTFTASEEKNYEIRTRGTIISNFAKNTLVYGCGGVWSVDSSSKILSASGSGKLIVKPNYSNSQSVLRFEYQGNIALPENAVTKALSSGWTLVTIPAEFSKEITFINTGACTVKQLSLLYDYGTYDSVEWDSSKGSVTVYGAKYKENSTTSFYSNTGDTVVLSAVPTGKNGFVGWYTNDAAHTLVSSDKEYVTQKTSSRINLKAEFVGLSTVSVDCISTWGLVSGTDYYSYLGYGNYAYGSSVTLTAEPKADCQFDGWYLGDTLVCSDAEYTFTMGESVNLEARFSKPGYVLITYSFDSTKGKIKSYIDYSDGTVRDIEKTTGYAYIDAVANEGYAFEGWYVNGVKVSNQATNFKLTGIVEDSLVEARFVPARTITFRFTDDYLYSFIYYLNGSNSGTNIKPGEVTSSDEIGKYYSVSVAEGTSIKLATYLFYDDSGSRSANSPNWEGFYIDGVETAGTYESPSYYITFTADADKTVELRTYDKTPYAIEGYTPADGVSAVKIINPQKWIYSDGVFSSTYIKSYEFHPLRIESDQTGVLIYEYKSNTDFFISSDNPLTKMDNQYRLAATDEWVQGTINISPDHPVFFTARANYMASFKAQVRNLRVVSGTATITADTVNENANAGGNNGGSVSGNTGINAIGETLTLTATPNQG